MGHHHVQTVPRAALIGAAVLIMTSIGLAAGARQARLAARDSVVKPAIEVVFVRFEDRPDGSLRMLDADTGRELTQVPPRSNGFVRGVLRGMFRSRKLEALDRNARFRLAREADGHLTLEDAEVGRRVHLDSFGPSNSAAFSELLAAARGAR
ncbi:MAG: putative photosynthetic complex assembly protein PuhC [Polyangiaceae bacterium]|jgi:putative photosynthetic complex assembly protein|nr:putative photosynthetic complex assembly protein PuhC [Polyangiaceae bacterium]